ncbi:hypothetical protein IWW57_002334, partial [Coemansia sp. S610]
IIKTWRSGSVGAISIPMMLMQTPGGFVFAYSIAIRPGVNWSSWISTFVAATLQCVLLVICLSFEAQAKSQRALESTEATANDAAADAAASSSPAAAAEQASENTAT